jgi:3-hydroxyacyl-CoA dehydrogenase/enoyl-CoA hydratase/3-hydroxybutyryl-CoA epimerase
MQLVEVVVGQETSPATMSRALRFVQQLGKVPVVVQDRPGFLVNRILLPYLVEAANAFESGVSVETIDKAMVTFGMPMGPLRLVDEVGLDIALDVASTLAAAFAPRMTVPPLLKRMIDAGLLGKKTGKGFHIHSGDKETAVNHGAEAFRRSDPGVQVPTPEEVQARMVYRMVDEAARCLEEGVVECAEDVDFGMVMGTGFPPFRGGPLRYVESIGAARAVQEMEAISITPCDLLYDASVGKKRLYV